ncbi:ATP synthase F1 subunit epsilon [Parabacteroides sp. OttesenSCG-928-G07]|nr:ATP synthase F1 subunit epsilon [Parabacteroides sp. OttesenSCG-928-G21]MDL2277975.1 ATP synthase F1 subunit epsilon [Parabacteroides sp. OttesenSCG-928-G07]
MTFKVITPQGVLYDKQIDSATFPGTLGDFTVLRNHAPLLTTLRKGAIRIVTGGQTETIEVETGIAEIKQNNIRVILG